MEAGVQPGGTGLQALNHVAIRNNAFNSITGPQIVEQLGPMDPSQEVWSNNLYSSTGAVAGALLVVLQGVPSRSKDWTARATRRCCRTWVCRSDPLGVHLWSVRWHASAATAFVTGARLESSQTWNPQYTATALIAYEQAGFEPG